MRLNEDFLHYIWQYRLLTSRDLYCTDGSALEIIDPGNFNIHAGPDFSAAKLRIAGTLWVGNVEIHQKASDWFLHHHAEDRSYDTVILHAVYENDAAICRSDGTVIPVLLLRDLIPESLSQRYRALLDARNVFPCESQIGDVDTAISRSLLDVMASVRLAEKSAELDLLLHKNKYNWNETFHQLLIRNFGFKVNSLPFELLAAGLPARLLARHRDHPCQVEALLFGQAGFLEGNFLDAYPRSLQAEYDFLRKKYKLVPLEPSIWKFLRMRPQNFPVLRIAQLAAILTTNAPSFSDILTASDLPSLLKLFKPIPVNEYWKEHDHFDKTCKPMALQLGRGSIEILIINTVCLLLYHYGWYFGSAEIQQRAICLLQKIPPEQNSLTASYQEAGLALKSAWDSQAILQLHKICCRPKKCLSCPVGMDIVGNGRAI